MAVSPRRCLAESDEPGETDEDQATDPGRDLTPVLAAEVKLDDDDRQGGREGEGERNRRPEELSCIITQRVR